MTRKRPSQPRLSDVARLAGVSLGSASRAISDPGAVRVKTRSAVEQAAQMLGYVTNGTARALATRRSMMVGVVLPTINNPVFAGFVHVLQRSLIASGYHLLVQAHEYDPAAEVALIEHLVRRGIDGLVLVGTDHAPAIFDLLHRTDMPHVFSWSSDEAGDAPCVGFSNRAAMRSMVDHLLALGHREFGVISGDTGHNERARARLDGVEEALMGLGIVLPEAAITFQPFSIEGGRCGLRALLKGQQRPTAVVCTTDLMAAGALAEATGLGFRVPDDLSICGFDDIDLASITSPPLTTVHAPIDEMGEAVGTRIVAAMRDGTAGGAMAIPTRLVLRGSTGAVPGGTAGSAVGPDQYSD